MAETTSRDVTIAGKRFRFRKADVVRAARGLEPEPIASHFVVVGLRRFPPKQLICAMTGLDRADLTTHQARRTLTRLGFVAGRKEARRTAAGINEQPVPQSARLESLAGNWVALKDDDVLHFAARPNEVVEWLAAHNQKADTMFRVPENAAAASGLAPL